MRLVRSEPAASRREPENLPLRRAHVRPGLRDLLPVPTSALARLTGFDGSPRQQVVGGQLFGLLRRLADGVSAPVRLARLVEALLRGARIAGRGEFLSE